MKHERKLSPGGSYDLLTRDLASPEVHRAAGLKRSKSERPAHSGSGKSRGPPSGRSTPQSDKLGRQQQGTLRRCSCSRRSHSRLNRRGLHGRQQHMQPCEIKAAQRVIRPSACPMSIGMASTPSFSRSRTEGAHDSLPSARPAQIEARRAAVRAMQLTLSGPVDANPPTARQGPPTGLDRRRRRRRRHPRSWPDHSRCP